MTTKENEMSEREQFEAKFPCPPKVYWRGGGHDYWTDSEFTDTDIIAYFEQNARWQAWQAAREQQAKELAEAQARVVVLEQHLSEILKRFPKSGLIPPDAFTARQALASTDTAAQKWIPVSERLPETPIKLGELKLPNGEVFKPQENSYEVLVWRKGGSADITKLIRADNGTTCWYLFNDEVTHWQPLPEPPAAKVKE